MTTSAISTKSFEIEQILQKDISLIPPQLNLLRKFFLEKYLYSPEYYYLENAKKFVEEIDKNLFKSNQKHYSDIHRINQLFNSEETNLHEFYCILQKNFFKDNEKNFNLLLLFFAYLKKEYPDNSNDFFKNCLRELLTPRVKQETDDDCSYMSFYIICDYIIVILHNMLLDTLLLKDYKSTGSSRTNMPFRFYEKNIMANIDSPSLSYYYSLRYHKKYIDTVKPQIEAAYDDDFEIFPALFCLCINRTFESIKKNKEYENQLSSYGQRIALNAPVNIDYLSAILAKFIKKDKKNINLNNRIRLQEHEQTEFRNICKNASNLYVENTYIQLGIRILLNMYNKMFPRKPKKPIPYEYIKPLIVLTKDNFSFTLCYEYFDSFIKTCNINEHFNKPLSLLHLNLYTHWVDACFIAHKLPHNLCYYPGLYLKALFCNKKYTSLTEIFFDSNLEYDLRNAVEDFFKLFSFGSLEKDYYVQSGENKTLMGFLSEPTKIDSSSTKCPIYYLGHNFSTPIAKPAPAPLVELYDWILELENKNDIDTLYEIYSTCLGEKYTSEEYYISLTELLTTYYENFSFGELINMDMSFPYNTNKLINKKTKFFFEYIESNKLYMKIKEE